MSMHHWNPEFMRTIHYTKTLQPPTNIPDTPTLLRGCVTATIAASLVGTVPHWVCLSPHSVQQGCTSEEVEGIPVRVNPFRPTRDAVAPYMLSK